MNKTLLITLITLLANCGILKAQNVNIPDANFKAALVGNASINTNGDGEIQVAEATAYVGPINVSGLNIYNLTGLEIFTNIYGLDCSVNQLTFLDIYPNPVSNYIQLKTANITAGTLMIYDVNGRLQSFAKFGKTVDISKLQSGSYLLRIIDQFGNNHYAKFIKI